MAPPISEWEKQMKHLDAEIRRLEAEFNMYFAGRLPRPPWETRTRVTALVKKYDQGYIRNTADRFRFETLQARFQKFIDICDRQMTMREMGRSLPGAKRTSQGAMPSALAQEAEHNAQGAKGAPGAKSVVERAREVAEKKADQGEKVVKFGRADAGADSRVKELYEQLAAAKKQVGEAPVAYERVAALVKAQVSKFADESTKVAFKIALKDGKVSLTVKPEKGE
ncbi:MAG: MXAN_5187 C-terminal domain-containing protein [Vicinamibacterales bacterium]